MLSTSVVSTPASSHHRFLAQSELIKQVEAFAARNRLVWFKDRSFFKSFEDGATLGLLTFQCRASGQFRGAFAFARCTAAADTSSTFVFAPEFVSDTLFAHFAEAFGHPSAFTSEQFRVFPAIL